MLKNKPIGYCNYCRRPIEDTHGYASEESLIIEDGKYFHNGCLKKLKEEE